MVNSCRTGKPEESCLETRQRVGSGRKAASEAARQAGRQALHWLCEHRSSSIIINYGVFSWWLTLVQPPMPPPIPPLSPAQRPITSTTTCSCSSDSSHSPLHLLLVLTGLPYPCCVYLYRCNCFCMIPSHFVFVPRPVPVVLSENSISAVLFVRNLLILTLLVHTVLRKD